MEKLSSIAARLIERGSAGTKMQLLSQSPSNQSRAPMKWPISNSR